MIERRLFVDLILLVSVFALPWWIVLLSAIACNFIFPNYIEALAVALLLDLLYGLNDPIMWIVRVPAFSVVALTYFVSLPIKRRLIFYNPRIR